jgi:hypothetical protein
MQRILCAGSPQYIFAQNALSSVDREVTPWLVVQVGPLVFRVSVKF